MILGVAWSWLESETGEMPSKCAGQTPLQNRCGGGGCPSPLLIASICLVSQEARPSPSSEDGGGSVGGVRRELRRWEIVTLESGRGNRLEKWADCGAAFKAQMRFVVIKLKRAQSACLGPFLHVCADQSRCRTQCDRGCGFALVSELSGARQRGKGAEGSAHQ